MKEKISEIKYLLEHREDCQFAYKELPLPIQKHFAARNYGM